MKQLYSQYTAEDRQVWQMLFDRQIANLQDKASNTFFEGLERIRFSGSKIPEFEQTNILLRKLTGWEIMVVPGIVADDVFFEMLACRKFPATTWLRSLKQLDYLEEPDMFHDVFGHIPLLTNRQFTGFLQSLAFVGLKHLRNPEAIALLSRIYWFTVEFGLIRENNQLKIYGAGLLSSPGESTFSLGTGPNRHPYEVAALYEQDYRKDNFQEKYFFIESFEELYTSVYEIETRLTVKNQLPSACL